MSDINKQDRIHEIFHEACDVHLSELDALLNKACDGDLEVRREVERLLAADRERQKNDLDLPDPPFKDVFEEIHRAADAIDSPSAKSYPGQTRPMECEQCGSQLDCRANENGGDEKRAKCSYCGGETWSFSLSEESKYPNRTLPARFQVDKIVGEGSFGIVYKARDSRLQRDVAIKVPKGETVSRKLFVREARAASQLRHENIVRILDVNDADDFAFIVSEYISGTSLNRWRKTHPLSAREACELCATISLAMGYAHECGVVHRDLKPSNIVMNDDGQPNVLDFGLSKSRIADESLVRPGIPIGTPAFMPPEQTVGNDELIDAKSDVYALGVILYQLLTGSLPFSGENIFDSICTVDADPIQSFDSRLPLVLNAIVMKALAKNPDDRYTTATEFASDLRRFLDGHRVRANPKIDARVVSRFAKRWSIISIATGLAVLLAASIYWAMSEYRQNNPLKKVLIETSVPNAELRWCRYDPITGYFDKTDYKLSRSGKPTYLQPGFYKVYVSFQGKTMEVFRTVPDADDTLLAFIGVPLKHRDWEEVDSVIRLTKIDFVVSVPSSDAIRVQGGKLVTGSGPEVGLLLRNRDVEIDSFWIANSEIDIEKVRDEFPGMKLDFLNYEIAAAYAEKVGASIPTIEEYLFLDKQNIGLNGMTTGLKEWTESPLPKVVLDKEHSFPGNLDKRMVLKSVDVWDQSKMKFRSISDANFVAPISSEVPEQDSGLRLIWRY